MAGTIGFDRDWFTATGEDPMKPITIAERLELEGFRLQQSGSMKIFTKQLEKIRLKVFLTHQMLVHIFANGQEEPCLIITIPAVYGHEVANIEKSCLDIYQTFYGLPQAEEIPF